MATQAERTAATKSALMKAALTIAAAEGIKNVTHRKVSMSAKVSVGTTSYHYQNLDSLLLDAFNQYIDESRDRYEHGVSSARTPGELADALIEMVNRHHSNTLEAILMYELYAQAGRDPRYRALVQRWSRATKTAVEHLYSAELATQLEAVVEGVLFQRLLGDSSLSDRQFRDLLLVILGQESTRPQQAG
ncbi:TetR/AcrR family transcriptional regulator [Mycolicibacterium baixiangningiae]|uniref:TetR/AcrR family transcriptional regulator n=1 Tax=Mycolicibacterium baixiangningiae TaxID=2761578 RepID=UPI0018D10C8D|nr:TetR family transcriptional regulator [Mycolicibacterium baixiangningiae]